MKHKGKDIDGIEAMYSVYGEPKKKKRIKRKVKDSKLRPEMKWENRKTKSEQ